MPLIYTMITWRYNQQHLTEKLAELLSTALNMQNSMINDNRDSQDISLREIGVVTDIITEATRKLKRIAYCHPDERWPAHKEIAAIGEQCRGRILAVYSYEVDLYRRSRGKLGGKVSGKIRRDGTPTEVIDSYLDKLSETELKSRDLVADIKNKIRLGNITMADGRPVIVGHNTVKDIVYKARRKRKIKSA